MKKVIFILTIIIVSLFGFAGCSKNATLYKGTIMKCNRCPCPNIVFITKSIHNGLPVNTSLIVSFVDDSTEVKQLRDGEKIKFKIIKYGPDTIPLFAICAGADYDATIDLAN